MSKRLLPLPRCSVALLICAVGCAARASDTLCLSDQHVTMLVSPLEGSVVGLSSRFLRSGKPWANADYALPADSRPLLQLLLAPGLALPAAASRCQRMEHDQTAVVELTYDSIAPGVALRATYRLIKGTYLLDAHFALCGDSAKAWGRRSPLAVRLASAARFSDAPAEGFAAGKRVPDWVVVRHGPAKLLPRRSTVADTIAPHEWVGPRNRFFALLAEPVANSVALGPADSTAARDLVTLAPDGASLKLRLYAGPIDRFGPEPRLAAVRDMLFSTLWFWMRWLSLGMLYLLHWLIALVGMPGQAVILLSVCVKILMWPLTATAEHWQRQVNQARSRLAPLLADVKKQYKGEEQHRRTLDVYKQQGVSTLYTFKSLASAAIQIPIFFAAYHMLSENVELAGVSFLWVRDLAFPDHAAALPFTLPFFGSYVNLLPLIMTSLTLLTSWIHRDHSLSRDLHRKQQVNLYLMALAFLALFYTFPAGMVLYWTTNNLLALILALWRRYRGTAMARAMVRERWLQRAKRKGRL